MAAKFPDDTPENEALLCPVCLEEYNDPRSLICAHTFCKGCIHQHVLQQKENGHLKKGIECPICREITPNSATDIQPEEWSNRLPVNYALQEVIASLRINFNLCKICLSKDVKNVATQFCIECNKIFCDECEKTHNILKHFQNHTFVRHEDEARIVNISDELAHCTTHGQLIDFYCIDDNTLCCSTCFVEKHRKCNDVAKILDFAEKHYKDKEITMVNKMKELKTKVNTVDNFFFHKRQEIDLQYEKIDQEVSKEHDKILNILKESRSKILAEANDVRNGANEQYQLYNGQCRSLSSSLESAFQNLDIIRENGTPVQQFIALHKQERQLEDNLRNGQELFDNLKYFDISAKGPSILPHLEKCKQKLKSKCIKVKAEEIPDSRVIKLERILSADLKAADGDGDVPFYSGLEFVSDGRLIAVDNKNKKIVLFNEQLEVVVKENIDLKPLDIVSISNENIFITTGNKIHKIRIKEDNALELYETIDIKRQAFSISCYNDGMFVIGTYYSQKPVALVSKNGRIKDFDIKFPGEKWKIKDHLCTFDEKNAALAITDSVENKVYIYDTDTKHESVIQDKRIKHPKGVASGPEHCFFVCSNETNTIVQISCAGDILHSHKIDMSYPYAICFSKDKTKMAVTNNKLPRKLQLYRIIT